MGGEGGGGDREQVKMTLFQACIVSAIIHGLEVLGRVTGTEMKEISKI